MVWPSPKRIAFAVCFLSWLAVQIFFFLPPGWPGQVFEWALSSKQGDFKIVQRGREAVLVGAFSDRYQRFPRLELIPYLRKKGVTEIREVILTGHDAGETGALDELQKNFQVMELSYPPDTALRMRKTFERVKSIAKFKRIELIKEEGAEGV